MRLPGDLLRPLPRRDPQDLSGPSRQRDRLGPRDLARWKQCLLGRWDQLDQEPWRQLLPDLLRQMLSSAAASTAAPALSSMLIYLLMAMVLVVRPEGLFPANRR